MTENVFDAEPLPLASNECPGGGDHDYRTTATYGRARIAVRTCRKCGDSYEKDVS